MKKRNLIVGFIFVLAAGVLLADEADWLEFYPLCLGDQREYLITYKGKEVKANVDIVKTYVENERKYYVMRSDENDVEYHIHANEQGVFLRRWRYPFPVLKFLKYTVKFDPPIPIIRYPLEVGKSWVYVGRGSVWFMGRDIGVSYVVKEQGTIKLALGDVKYFKVSGLVNDSKALYEEFYYYGWGYGYIKGHGRDRRDVIVDYRPSPVDAEQQPDK